MHVIWVIATVCAIYSCSATQNDDNQSLDSGFENEARRTITSGAEEYDLETSYPEFENSTDQNAQDDLELDKSTVVPKETTKREDEVTTTAASEFYVPRHRRKDPPVEVSDTCGEPPSIEHAEVVGVKKSSYSLGDVITYSCEFGYVTDGGIRTAQCVQSENSDSLQWTEPATFCIPRSCGEPGFVNNGNRIGSLFVFPNSITFECEEGYKLKGNRIRYCQPSGTWSGTLPSCQKLKCDPPPDIENGRVIYSSLEFGSELRYQCNNGFILRKHQNRFCSANGTWSGDDPVCQDAHCEPPEAPQHGSVQVIGGRSSVDSRAIYTCDGDKILLGSKTSICLETGEWTFPTPKCLDRCSVPEVPHGRIGRYRYRHFRELDVGTRIELGEELYLRCDRTYEALGKSSTEEKIVCSHGEWKDIPRCEPARCSSDPPKTPNADYGRITRTHGGGVVYHCFRNFKKTVFGNVTCTFGSWIGKTPVCSDSRCYLNTISFPGLMKLKKSVFYDGQAFTPTCDINYTVAKPGNRLTCKSGTWMGHLPPCTAASCRDEPPSIQHGTYKPYTELHSSTVAYECDKDFVLKESGSSQVQCLFGKWMGTPPTCKDSRCHQRDLQFTRGMIMDGGVTLSEDYMAVSCEDGFTSTDAQPFCLNGIWTQPDEPCVENDCATHEIRNGHFARKLEKKRFSLSMGRYTEISFVQVARQEIKAPGSSLHVKCNVPYTFQGNGLNTTKVSCSKGKWIPHPVCLSTGTVFIDDSTTAQKAKVETKISSTRKPISTTAPAPLVLPTAVTDESCTCTYYNRDRNLVAYSGTELLQHGTKVKNNCKVKFHCNDGGFYRLNGNIELECKNCRDWHSSEYPQCDPPTLGDVIIRFDDQSTVLPGGAIAFKEGGNVHMTCLAHTVHSYPTWKVPTDRNVRFNGYFEQSSNPEHRGGWYAASLDISNANPENSGMYECYVTGYRSKTFEIQVISSARRCSHIEETSDLAVNYDNGQVANSSVFFSCKQKDSKLVGSSVLTCLPNGHWSGDPPHCKREVKCPELKESEGLSITYTKGLTVDSIATFHCFSPRRTEVATSTCKGNGQWSNQVPLCSLPNCSVDALFRSLPENVISDMENVNSPTVPYNFTLRLKCEEGLILHGHESAKCGTDGEWEVPKVQCVLGCVSLKSPGASLIIEPDQNVYRFGEFVTLSCPPGEFLSSEVVRLMCLNSGWSETVIPRCQVE